MRTKNSFVKDLISANQAETYLATLLSEAGFTVNCVGKQKLPWDLEVSGFNLQFTIEVKFDIYQAKSGNIAIEVFNAKTSAPSGLYSSQATLWCQKLKDSTWLCRTDLLRAFTDAVTPTRIIEVGGDNNATLYLYKEAVILPAIFFEVSKLNSLEIRQLCQNILT